MDIQEEIKQILKAVDSQRMTWEEAQLRINQLYVEYYGQRHRQDTDIEILRSIKL